MLFEELPVAGVYRVSVERRADDRGFFARTFCRDEFSQRGLVGEFSQTSISVNPQRGTVRGLHFQLPPQQETKLVRCTKGEIFDVVADVRSGSRSFKKWVGVRLSEDNREALYIPAGVAHGFQTLSEDAEVLYYIDLPHMAGFASGVRWNDPSIGVRWPEPITKISERDLQFGDLAT